MDCKTSLLKMVFGAVFAGGILSGCVTTTLQTNAKMTQSIFLDPVAKSQRIIFLSVRNTSGHDVNLESKLVQLLTQKGYKIVDDPAKATYILSTNILYCDEKKENNAAAAAGVGAAVGTGVGVYNHSSVTGGAVGGLIGAGIGALAGKLTEDTIWQMQVDINIKQRAKGGVLTTSGNVSGQAQVNDQRRAGFLNSFGGNVRSSQSGHLQSNQINSSAQSYSSDYIEKSTIIFAEAVKLGLKLPEATPILEDKIASQIAGLF
ncbi:complement resistance protein TraT [uncultured Helicobacter sp.]|uniref:complement resistance protein TraT n=1 Tax=uncultured Helicobacter sp. TaxID=175537 RepID=UPI002636AD82|nr:complement resistance protein TraT [uncultured Helicobacter sp.]